MKASGPKKNAGRSPGAEGARGFYVYCIGESDALSRLFESELPGAIESGAELEIVAEDDLAAVVSAVPLSDYGEESLTARLAEPSWTAVRAMRHEKVVEHFASRTSVVPLRFGTIYLQRAGVEQMLSERRAELVALVQRLRGREEWGLNIYCDRATLKENIARLSPRLRDLSERADAAQPGQAYLLRKKIDALRADEERAEMKRVAAAVEEELMGLTDGAVRLRVLKDEATEHGELAAKLAFLVDRARFEEFRKAAERLVQKHAAAGFRFELTGPWPAYNFTGGTPSS